MNKINRLFKKHMDEVMKTKTSPHSIALGFAIGVLIAILPTPGFSVLLGVLIVLIFKDISKYSLFIALAIFNPIFMIPFYILSYYIGNLLFSTEPVIVFNVVFWDAVYNYTRRYLVGNVIVAVVTSFVSYFVVKYVVKKYEQEEG